MSHKIWKRREKARNYTQIFKNPGHVKFSLLMITLLVSKFDKGKVTPFKQIFEVQEGDVFLYLTLVQIILDHYLPMS